MYMTVQLNNNSHLLVMEIPESRCIVGYLNISSVLHVNMTVFVKIACIQISFTLLAGCLGIRSKIIFATKFVAKMTSW